MLSGNLRHNIELYKPSGDNNNIEYSYYKTIKAQILYKNGSSVIQSYQLLNTKSISIKIRNRKDIDTSMRVKIGAEFFDILHIQTIGSYNGDILLDLALIV
ncbi:head-tail adaptor protein [Gaoshiqia sediminis]|uniref:Head-tail adaptor protein n=1 Tax=Gaoshiqia sediminis TaxID=2986998 RepID=A0AA41YAF3_9BACT|nr:head-tail adaptor protein [Gaoshiqia sediminis]MCW0484661.1 head-tail adaptor protein [Gaoshiqia sediminis]